MGMGGCRLGYFKIEVEGGSFAGFNMHYLPASGRSHMCLGGMDSTGAFLPTGVWVPGPKLETNGMKTQPAQKKCRSQNARRSIGKDPDLKQPFVSHTAKNAKQQR